MVEYIAFAEEAPAGAEAIVRCHGCDWSHVSERPGERTSLGCGWWHRKVPPHGHCHIGRPKAPAGSSE